MSEKTEQWLQNSEGKESAIQNLYPIKSSLKHEGRADIRKYQSLSAMYPFSQEVAWEWTIAKFKKRGEAGRQKPKIGGVGPTQKCGKENFKNAVVQMA